MPSRRRDLLLDRAALEASLATGPETSALRSLLMQSHGERERKKLVNASNARGVTAATKAARAPVEKAFGTALGSVAAQRAALGGADAVQGAAYERRVRESQANALTDLAQQGVRATAGRVFADQAADDAYQGDRAKVSDQMLALSQKQGALTASTYGKLQDDAADRGIRAGSARETGRHNRAMEANAAASRRARGSGSGGAGAKPATRVQHAQAKDSIDEATRWIKKLSQGPATSTDIRGLLERGGSINQGAVKVPRFSKDFVNAAFDVEVKGYLSPANIKALHRRGLRIKTLGYRTKPKPSGPASYPAAARPG